MRLALLGSTGSIGTQALEVARRLPITISALAAHSNIDRLEAQIREFRPALAAVYDRDAAEALRLRVADLPVRVVAGMQGLCEAARSQTAEVVLNAVVGMVGLEPTLAALEAGKRVALANKETLVAGGALVMAEAARRGLPILPVDSEHSAVFQCLQGAPQGRALSKVILTASGGPFFGWRKEELAAVTPEQALRHPNWSMGAKVTIDSATMMNKGLEVIEASWLFGLPAEKIDVVVHRESIVHSLVEFEDGAVLAQLGEPDMKLPIQYALTYPGRLPCPVKRLHLSDYGKLTFYEPDEKTFSCLALCRLAAKRGGLAPAAANGANEQAVALFLQGKIPFLAISELVALALERQPDAAAGSVEAIFEADRAARRLVLEAVQKQQGACV